MCQKSGLFSSAEVIILNYSTLYIKVITMKKSFSSILIIMFSGSAFSQEVIIDEPLEVNAEE